MKKLMFVVEALEGGVFTYIVELANALADRYEISLVYGLRKQTPSDFQNALDPRIALYRVIHFCRALNPIEDMKAFVELRSIVARVQPDVIHLHSSKAGALGRWAVNGKKMPLFYTPHGYSFLMRDCSAVKRRLYRCMEKLCALRACTTICCGEGEYREAIKLTKQSLCICNGINVERLQDTLSQQSAASQHPFTVFVLGRVCLPKNPQLVNEIALAMPEVRFLWIGDGEMREVLKAPNIVITGWLEREEALRQAMQADMFLLPSRWEGLPFALLEAMYLRKACVVSCAVGELGVISHLRNGFVCSDKASYVAAICQIREKGAAMQVEQAYDDVLAKYNTKVMVQRYDEIYKAAVR